MIELTNPTELCVCDRGLLREVTGPVVWRRRGREAYAFAIRGGAVARACPVCNGRGIIEVVEGQATWRKDQRPA